MSKKERLLRQFETIVDNRGKLFRLSQLKELLGIAPTTSLQDTWFYKRGFLRNIEYGTWMIERF